MYYVQYSQITGIQYIYCNRGLLKFSVDLPSAFSQKAFKANESILLLQKVLTNTHISFDLSLIHVKEVCRLITLILLYKRHNMAKNGCFGSGVHFVSVSI